MVRRIVLPLLVLAGGVGASAFAAHLLKAKNAALLQANLEILAEDAIQDVTQRLTLPFYGLAGFRGAVAMSDNLVPTPEEVRRYTASRDLPLEFPGVLGFGVVERIKHGEQAALEARLRANGDPLFVITGEGAADDLYVITAVEPKAANRPAVGFDIGSEANRRQAAERTFHIGVPSVTAPVRLKQDPLERPGSLLMLPLFASGQPTSQGPDDPVIGLVYAAMVYPEAMKGLVAEHGTTLRIRIEDRGTTPGVMLFDSSPDAEFAAGLMPFVREFPYFGRTLHLTASATPAFIAANSSSAGTAVLFFGALASLLAAFLLRQQGSLRTRAETLAQSMTRDLARLADVARLTKSAVVVTDAAGRIEWTNPAFRALSGYSEDELLGRTPGSLLQTSGTDAGEIQKIRQALREAKDYHGVLLNRSKEGREYHVELEIQPRREASGQLSGFIAIETDISRRLEREARLRANEALLDRTGELGTVGGWRLDVATGELAWSRMTYRIHEVEDDYVPEVASAIEFYAPEARPRITAAVEKGMQDGSGWDLELGFITATGRRRWVRAVGEPEYENGRLVALNGALADVTEAVEARERIRQERERFAMILTGTGAGTWEWNIQTGETRFNERWAEIVGHRLADLEPVSIQTWLKLAHAEDLIRSSQLLDAHFRGETEDYACEARMRHRDGHWVWVADRGKVMTWTEDGRPEWMFGTHLDITERKKAELQLAESEALLSTTLHSIGDAVLTADAEGRVTWINPVAETLTGWTNDEARGRMAAEVLQLEIEGQSGWAPCPVMACLREGRKVGLAGSTTLVSRDGSRFVIEDSAAPLREVEGRTLGVVMVFHDVTEKAQLAKEMSFRATHDTLTGLTNRLEFESELDRALGRVKAGRRPGVLMFLDLDHFKLVNDACGHAAGDRLLVQIAALFSNEVRSRDLVARFGGDEFAILLEDCPVEQGRRIGQKIVDVIDHYRFAGDEGRRFRVGVSIGLVPMDNRWLNLPQLIQAADMACYAAKSEGRNRLVVEEGVVTLNAAKRQIQWGPVIEQALDEDAFTLFGQRVVPLEPSTASMLRCEVLLRLKSEDGALHNPGTFIPAAERYQLASHIDRWVLRHLIETLKSRSLASVARVAVNLSGQSVGDRAFHRFALDTIEASGLPPDRLCIEITETTAVTHLGDAARFIDDLHAIGVQVALDDFGAGSASFGYLKSLKVDVLKIDGQFVRGLLQGELESAALRSFVDVARVLDLRTVAEQVETEAIARKLLELGVDFGQGYFFHRPEPLQDLLDAWENRGSNVVAGIFNAKRRGGY